MGSLTNLVDTGMPCRDEAVRLLYHLKGWVCFCSDFTQLVKRVAEEFTCLFLPPDALKVPEPAPATLSRFASPFLPSFLIPTFFNTLGFAPTVSFYPSSLFG